MQVTQPKNETPKGFQEKISLMLEQSLSEEQRFLQGILSGKIKTYSHEEVVCELRKVLKR